MILVVLSDREPDGEAVEMGRDEGLPVTLLLCRGILYYTANQGFITVQRGPVWVNDTQRGLKTTLLSACPWLKALVFVTWVCQKHINLELFS